MYEFPVLGQINFYRFVPLDNTYTNTLHFKTREDQLAYFKCSNHDTPYSGGNATGNPDTILKLTYTNQTYTRNERQYIRVESNAQMLMDCNYLAYQNRNFGNNWFFAFVVAVEYVNDYVAEVVFELDVMQTFMWNFELRDCFVLREHVKDDTIGKSLTPEPIYNRLYYKIKSVQQTNLFNDYAAIVVTSFDPEDVSSLKDSATYLYGGLFTGGVSYYETPNQLRTALRSWEQQNLIDGIIAIYYVPKHFVENNKIFSSSVSTETITINRPQDINGYTPKNNKLFTYPFTALTVDTYESQKTYKPEFFPNGDITFTLQSSMQSVPQILLTPNNYEGTNNLLSNGVIMKDFIPVGYNYSQFKTWWAEHITPIITRTAINVAQMAGGIATNNPTIAEEGATAFANTVTTTLINTAQAATLPPTHRNGIHGGIDTATRKKDFYFIWEQVHEECAEMVDRFFSQFGYAVGKLKRPEIWQYDNCRSKWNFIQAINCNFHWDLFSTEGKGTSVPIKYITKIEEIFANGITFWKNPLEVGHYLTETGELKDNP